MQWWFDGSEGAAHDDRIREAGLDPDNLPVRSVQLFNLVPRQLMRLFHGIFPSMSAASCIAQRFLLDAPGARGERSHARSDPSSSGRKTTSRPLGLLKVDVLALGMLSDPSSQLGDGPATRFAAWSTRMQGYSRPRKPVSYEMISEADTDRRVPGRKSRAQMSDAAAPQAELPFTTSSSRSPSCVPAPSREAWCILTCGGGQGPEPVDLSQEPLRIESVLSRTLGVPIFQEQVMQLADGGCRLQRPARPTSLRRCHGGVEAQGRRAQVP
jgi:error-prone DNA polymerase